MAPSYYAPTRNLERAQRRAATVVSMMAREGYLTEAEAAAAIENPATLSEAADQNVGGYFADWIMAEGPDFLTSDTTEDVIIRTTFDPAMQAAAEAALDEVFANQVRESSEAQAAIVVMSADGAVRAMVGGRDTQGAGRFNRATQAMRQNRIGLQALRLCHGARSRFAVRRHDTRRAADHRRAGLGSLFALELFR